MNTMQPLVEQMERIVRHEYKVPKDVKPFSLALKMLDIIGIEDAHIRDDLVYMVMATWISEGIFSHEELRKILQLLLNDQHLFYRIGENHSDTVFTRSFSILLIPLIIEQHMKDSFLKDDELDEIYYQVIRYCKEEQDVRGYVEGKGWAHTAAHTADAMSAMVLLPNITHERMMHILDLIRDKVCIGSYQYIHQEDERMVAALLNILDRNRVSLDAFNGYILSYEPLDQKGIFPDDMYLMCNVKHFLRSLYFRLLARNGYKKITDSILQVLNAITPFHD
ncbi:DUF2785 domain-containing protein [Vallitalea pronyensis]|uniref:DUF2785 domain-containing protein n=1 Tax=Vallitalea pronyensis TaxID=1348613 RepID=A0A8J8SHD7_9FIRM|nr:DUF2785 domain-containing protein [Vallitalea pronyensis]QUI23755.1 DUF2785 domain-containing protein [Vallitalea pronyensis]